MRKTIIFIFLIATVSAAQGFSFTDNRGRLAVVELTGSIGSSGGILSAETITPQQVRELNQRAVNQNADAILYEINSGGGAVVASKEVMREIQSQELATVCRMRDIAASGGYLLATGCDHITADRSTLTGSIGVQASYQEYSGLMNRLGIEYVNITAGSRKDIGSPYRNASDQDRKVLSEKTEAVHEDFKQIVEEKRNLSGTQLETVGTGEVFLGEEAMRLGLVDSLGGREKAISKAEDLTGKELESFQVERPSDFSILKTFLGKTGFSFQDGISPLMAVY